MIKRLFEPIPRGPSPKHVLPPEPEQRGERRFLLKREAQVPFVMTGFRIPNYSSDDSYALDLLESILSHGKSSRLYQSLVYDQKMALAVGADYSLLQTDPGLFYFYAVVNPGTKVEAVEEALQREVLRLQNEPHRSWNSNEPRIRWKRRACLSKTRIFAMPCSWDKQRPSAQGGDVSISLLNISVQSRPKIFNVSRSSI